VGGCGCVHIYLNTLAGEEPTADDTDKDNGIHTVYVCMYVCMYVYLNTLAEEEPTADDTDKDNGLRHIEHRTERASSLNIRLHHTEKRHQKRAVHISKETRGLNVRAASKSYPHIKRDLRILGVF
jgi:hypothetical protein